MNDFMGKCTVLVCSCDAYSDLWDPFFTLLNVYWPTRKFPIWLSTESKEYCNKEFPVQTIHPKGRKNMPWSKRIKQVLQKIDSPYILLLLDDFFLKAPVNEQKVEECILWMDQNKDIANFSFVPSLWEDICDKEFPGFERRPCGGRYKVNCQAGLWRTSMLLKLMRACEDPWELEWNASCRSDLYPWRFYAAEKPKPWVFDYDFSSGGGGVHRGKWTRGVERVFEKHAIAVDFSIRGWDDSPAPPFGTARKNPPAAKITWRSEIKYFIQHWKAYL